MWYFLNQYNWATKLNIHNSIIKKDLNIKKRQVIKNSHLNSHAILYHLSSTHLTKKEAILVILDIYISALLLSSYLICLTIKLMIRQLVII